MMGYFFECNQTISSAELLICFIVTIVLFIPIGELLLRFKKLFNDSKYLFVKKQKQGSLSNAKYFWIVAAILFTLYFIVFLAYYPGIFGYDATDQINQTFGSYNTMSPLLHTLWLQAFYSLGKLLGSCTIGIAMYSIVQMIAFVICLSYVNLFFYKIKVKAIIRYIVVALIGILPVFSIISFSTTKDTLFSALFAILVVTLFYWETSSKYKMSKLNIAIYVFCLVAIISLRNNGVIALFICIIACLFMKFACKKQFIVWTIVGLIITALFTISLTSVLHASRGTIKEALSIPYQQMACVYNKEANNLSEEDKAEIENIIPRAKEYNPYLSDPVKDYAIEQKDKTTMPKTWFKFFTRFPGRYVEAFINNNLGYLYLFDVSCSQIYGTNVQDRFGVIQTNVLPNYGVEHTSYFPALESLYEWLYTSNNYQKIPILNILCSPALYFWLILLFLAYSIIDKKAPFIMQIFVISYIITILLGPCSLLRYALPYIVCVPVIMFGYARNYCTNLESAKDD